MSHIVMPPRRQQQQQQQQQYTSQQQKARYLEHLEHIIQDEKQLFQDLTNHTYNNNNGPPTCARHPRWITFGCIIFSVMLSSTLLMTRNWQSHSIGRSSGEIEREWVWPEMDPWKMIALVEKEDSEDLPLPSSSTTPIIQQPQQHQKQESGAKDETAAREPPQSEIKTWDMNDPSLTLGTFLDSPEWKTQSLVPGADFVNLLRVLRPIDHAFFITLFINQSPGQMEAAKEGGKGMSPKASTMTAKIPIHGQHGCGSWIQDYIEYQDGIVDEVLSARYTTHACSSTDVPPQQHEQKEQQKQQQQPCGDLFSQMIAMTSAFAWSVKESRGFFLRPDQIHHLQDSFRSPVLQQQWSLPPSLLQYRQKETQRAVFVKVDTEEMTTRELVELFGLEDALFSGLEEEDDEDDGEGGVQGRLWALRSKSRNRASFERTLLASNDPIANLYQSATPYTPGGQKRIGKAITSSRMKELKDSLESDGVELVLQQDLLPLFINTTTTLDQIVDLGLPLPDHILVEHQAHQKSSSSADQTTTSTTKPTSIRAPSAHGSLFSSSSISSSSSSSSFSSSGSNGPTHQAISTALHAALHDIRDMSRIQAAPKSFGCLLDILLQPQLDLQQLIHPYTTLFKLPAVFSIGIFIKPDSSSSPPSNTPHSSSSSWKSMSVDRQRTVDRYLTCARQIAREFAPKRRGQKVVYVVVSEDAGMARVMESREEWDEEVITPSWGPYKDRGLLHRPPRRTHSQLHQESENDSNVPPKQLTKQQQQVLENWVLSKTDFQVVSDQSDFAKVAVWRTRREGRSVVIRENPALETFMKEEQEQEEGGSGGGGSGYVDMLDCGTLLNNLVIRD